MKRIIFLLLCLAVALCVKAQEAHTTATLYSYGKPLETCETNLENLFANVPKFLENDEDLDLLSFQYVGDVQSVKHARSLVKKNFKDLPLWAVGMVLPKRAYRDREGGFYEKMTLNPTDDFPAFIKKKEAIKTISNEYIHKGDKIYLLRFVYNLRTVEHYVFIHADTKEVVTEGNPFGFDIPLAYLRHFDKPVAER